MTAWKQSKKDMWASVRDAAGLSVWVSVVFPAWDAAGFSVRDAVRVSVENFVWDSVWDAVGDSVSSAVENSVRTSMWRFTYIDMREIS